MDLIMTILLAAIIISFIFFIVIIFNPDAKFIHAKDPKVSRRWKKRFKYSIFGFVGIIIILVVIPSVIAIVPAGHVGIYDLFGVVDSNEWSPGLYFKNPFAHVETLSIRTQEYTMSTIPTEGAIYGTDVIPALTKEGLTVNLDMTVLYRLAPISAADIYKTIGVNYVDVIVRPQIRTAIRDVVARYQAKDIYSTERQIVADEIFDEMEESLVQRGIILERVLLRNVKLPTELTIAIEAKLTAEQMIEKKAFEVQVETEEANRKRIEAQGIADANAIIANSLTPAYLTWYWIDNLDTHNSVIYVPVGEGGMPIFKEVGTGD